MRYFGRRCVIGLAYPGQLFYIKGQKRRWRRNLIMYCFKWQIPVSICRLLEKWWKHILGELIWPRCRFDFQLGQRWVDANELKWCTHSCICLPILNFNLKSRPGTLKSLFGQVTLLRNHPADHVLSRSEPIVFPWLYPWSENFLTGNPNNT